MAKREDIEDVIRMAVRVAGRYAKEGIVLRWTLHYDPAPTAKPQITVTGNSQRTKTVASTVNRQTKTGTGP